MTESPRRVELPANEVTQILQFRCQINTVDDYLFRHLKHRGREIQNPLYAGAHQAVGDALREFRRNTENGKADGVLREK